MPSRSSRNSPWPVSYTHLAGGCVDDLIVYKVREETYLVVVNAANKDKDAAWMAEHLTGACKMEDISETVAQVALQGPKSKEILLKL